MQTTTTKATSAKAPKTAAKATAAKPATTVAPTLAVKAVTATPALLAAALANPTAYSYALGAAATAIAAHSTLQRGCTAPVGKNWRENGHKAPNTRHVVVTTLAKALGTQFSYAAAVEVLKPLKTAAILGSGTPASYIRAFIKCGYLVPVAKAA